MRYNYYTNGKNMVVCTSTYAGKVVRGVAKCSPDDTFDLEYGKKLAKARCDHKVSIKRFKRAMAKLHEANAARDVVNSNIKKAQSYVFDAVTAMAKCNEAITTIEEECKN